MSGVGQGLAGRMRERVELLRADGGRDALGAADAGRVSLGMVWASVAPLGVGADYAGGGRSALPLWRVTLRPCAVAVGDRISRVENMLEVREVLADPALPDRVVAIAEQRR